MTNDDLVKLQKTQLEILRTVVNVCNKHNINYSVMYGTLLGTIRHKGVIPWDNDIDIMMTREEFRKFYSVKKDLPDNLAVNFLYIKDSDKVPEVRISNIKTLQYGVNHKSKKGNVSIDIFVFDDAKLYSARKTSLIIKYVNILKFILLDDFEREWLYDIHKNNKLKLAFIKATEFLSKKTDKQSVINKIINILMSSNETGYIRCWGDSDNVIYNKKDFENCTLMKYEDLDVCVPVNYDELLRKSYGDYMKLPPENERFTSSLSDFVVEYLE